MREAFLMPRKISGNRSRSLWMKAWGKDAETRARPGWEDLIVMKQLEVILWTPCQRAAADDYTASSVV